MKLGTHYVGCFNNAGVLLLKHYSSTKTFQYLINPSCFLTRTWLSQTDRVSAAHTIRRGHLRDLEIYVKGHSKSLEMEPLDRSYTTYC